MQTHRPIGDLANAQGCIVEMLYLRDEIDLPLGVDGDVIVDIFDVIDTSIDQILSDFDGHDQMHIIEMVNTVRGTDKISNAELRKYIESKGLFNKDAIEAMFARDEPVKRRK